jgi:hypothetical protein
MTEIGAMTTVRTNRRAAIKQIVDAQRRRRWRRSAAHSRRNSSLPGSRSRSSGTASLSRSPHSPSNKGALASDVPRQSGQRYDPGNLQCPGHARGMACLAPRRERIAIHLGLIAFVACPVDYRCSGVVTTRKNRPGRSRQLRLFRYSVIWIQRYGSESGEGFAQPNPRFSSKHAATRAAKRVGLGTFVYGQGSILSSRTFKEIKE